MTVRRLALALAAFVVASCAGGGPAACEVRGKVTRGGAPLAGAFVTLHPRAGGGDAPHPGALTGPDGTFRLTAPPGEYAVTVVHETPAKRGRREGAPDALRGRYARPDGSGLAANVHPGANDLPPFELQ